MKPRYHIVEMHASMLSRNGKSIAKYLKEIDETTSSLHRCVKETMEHYRAYISVVSSFNKELEQLLKEVGRSSDSELGDGDEL